MILMYPIITRKVGIDAFGLVMLANAFAGVMGILINYGTNQTGIRDVAAYTNYRGRLSETFYTILWIRLFVFILIVLAVITAGWYAVPHYKFYLLAMPLIFAEVINPLFFYLGKQWLSAYNVANMFTKMAIIISILVFIKRPDDAAWVNFCMGMLTVLTYSVLLLYAIIRFKLPFSLPKNLELKRMAKDNFFLTGNNISVHLQQSLMLFALAKWGNVSWLGAYSLCDKIIWSSRILIMSVSNALYPKAAQLFTQDKQLWQPFKNRMKKLISLLFLGFSIVLFLFPDLIIRILAGEPNETAVNFLRIMAFVPAIAALNVLNVMDLLLKNEGASIFRIAIVLVIIAVLLAVALVKSGEVRLFGIYTLIIELCALVSYEYVIRYKIRKI